MTTDDDKPSPLDALSDDEYEARISAAIERLMDAVEAAMKSDDEVESELLYAAAPTALRNTLAFLIAEQSYDQPKPFKLVKELVRDLDLERMALSLAKDLKAEAGEAGES